MSLELLESRTFFAVTMEETYPGFHHIYGDENANEIIVRIAPDAQSFTMNGIAGGVAYYVWIHGYGGDDNIRVSGPKGGLAGAMIGGGDGNDFLSSSLASTVTTTWPRLSAKTSVIWGPAAISVRCSSVSMPRRWERTGMGMRAGWLLKRKKRRSQFQKICIVCSLRRSADNKGDGHVVVRGHPLEDVRRPAPQLLDERTRDQS